MDRVHQASPLLRLPRRLRQKIYIFSGLVRGCPVVLPGKDGPYHEYTGQNREGSCRHQLKRNGCLPSCEESGVECFCENFPTQLLLVSKTVYSEVHSLLYGENKLVIRCHSASDLQFLRSFSSDALASLQQLLIRLNCWPCVYGHDACADERCKMCWSDTYSSDPPLDKSTTMGQDLIKEWTDLCSRMGQHITPGQLELTVICDTIDAESARQIVDPLARLPRLKGCNMRLGRQRDPSLLAIARSTSRSLTGRRLDSSPFPFERLPRELRLHILKFSHLGPSGSYPSEFRTVRVQENRLWNGKYYTSPYLCCGECTINDYCCCPVYYASHSESCQCRVFPLELCLVSKQMRQDALEILYATNRFEFRQSPDLTLAFLSALSQDSRQYIRQMSFIFYQNNILQWDPAVQGQSWANLIQYMSSNLKVSNLSLEIHVNLSWDMEDYGEESDFRKIFSTYCDMLQALKPLRRMSNRDRLTNLELDLSCFQELVPAVENYVFGEDYEGNKENKDRKPFHDLSKLQYPQPPDWITTELPLKFPAWEIGQDKGI